jgi:hypothetical protein
MQVSRQHGPTSILIECGDPGHVGGIGIELVAQRHDFVLPMIKSIQRVGDAGGEVVVEKKLQAASFF